MERSGAGVEIVKSGNPGIIADTAAFGSFVECIGLK
jgi:hypothetical protein